jgi:hypothetical protein
MSLKYCILLLLCAQGLCAQTFGGYRQGYLSLGNYNGNRLSAGITLFLDGQNTVNMPNWRITAKVTSQVPTDGKVFPANKMSLQPAFSQGTANPSPVPSVSQVGFLPSVTLSTTEQDLVTRSNAPIYNTGGYYRWEFKFDWSIEGGAYLSELQKWKEYRFNIEFRFYNHLNQLVGTIPLDHIVQVGDLGNPPVQNTFGLTINGGARNGALTLQSRSDYENGANVVYSAGLTVNTNVPYQLTVNASAGTPHFTYSSHSLDLDVLNVYLNTQATSVTALNTVTLSTGAQILAKGKSTDKQNVNFDVGYQINPQNREKLFLAFKEASSTYSTTLQYTLMAQ